jgi:hypothetical protein
MPRTALKPKDYWKTNKNVTGVGPEDRGLRTAFDKNSTVRCPNGHKLRVRTHLVLNHRNEIVGLHCPSCRKNGKPSHFSSYEIK